MKRLIALLFLGAAAALGADLNGTWKASAEGPNGPMERTFTFKVEGAKLTGETTSSLVGKSTITDGKVDGDNFSFQITAKLGDDEMTITCKGKVTGDQLQLTSESAGNSFEWKGKKTKE